MDQLNGVTEQSGTYSLSDSEHCTMCKAFLVHGTRLLFLSKAHSRREMQATRGSFRGSEVWSLACLCAGLQSELLTRIVFFFESAYFHVVSDARVRGTIENAKRIIFFCFRTAKISSIPISKAIQLSSWSFRDFPRFFFFAPATSRPP